MWLWCRVRLRHRAIAPLISLSGCQSHATVLPRASGHVHAHAVHDSSSRSTPIWSKSCVESFELEALLVGDEEEECSGARGGEDCAFGRPGQLRLALLCAPARSLISPAAHDERSGAENGSCGRSCTPDGRRVLGWGSVMRETALGWPSRCWQRGLEISSVKSESINSSIKSSPLCCMGGNPLTPRRRG